MTETERQLAADAGWNAFFEGQSLDSNPYTEEDLRDEWTAWWWAANGASEETI
jgi:ribosome modulation factor